MRAPSDNRRAMRRLGPGTSKYLDVRYRFPVPVFYRLEGKRKPETPSAVRPHLFVNFRENRSIEYRGHSHLVPIIIQSDAMNARGLIGENILSQSDNAR